MLDPVTDQYPRAMISIVNKPLIAYQLEYLQNYGVEDIMITVERKYVSRIEKYLKQFYMSKLQNANVELVVFQEEETSINVISHLSKRIYSNTDAQQRDFIIMESNTLLDIPLDELIKTHTLASSSITALVKEFDMNKGGKGPKVTEVDGSDIFGLSSYDDEQYRTGADSSYQFNRIVLKMDKYDAQPPRKVNLKSSFMKNFQQMEIRTDLNDCGLYVLTHSLFRLIAHMLSKKVYAWSDISDMLPYFARNQFKQNLQKMMDEAMGSRKRRRDLDKDMKSKIELLMNPDLEMKKKDQIKIMAHIDPHTSGHTYMRLKNIKFYKNANLEGQLMPIKYAHMPQLANKYKVFQPTENNIPDVLSLPNAQIGQIKMSNIAVLGGDLSTINIGENTSIQKSVIGRNVEIGTKTKISNSIILGNCKIGNDCIIQNSLILNKCTIADKSKISEKEIAHGSDYPQLE